MNNNWQYRLQQLFRPTPPPQEPPKPSLPAALEKYQRVLTQLNDDTASLLPALLARDEVAIAWNSSKAPTPKMANQLFALDGELQKNAPEEGLALIGGWRNSFHPAKATWWWRLDEAQEKREQERDLLWEIIAVTLFILTVPLIVDIIQRLWANAPDNAAIVGTLMILLVTASPFTKRGRELTQWILKRVSWLPSHRRAEAMAMTAVIAFALVAIGRFVVMPQYAGIVNNQGVAALERGDLTAARQQFQRAAAINKDFSVGYYNLAALYEEVAQPDEAIALYQEAIAHNLDLSPAYNNLGRLYLQQGDARQAITLLRAGLDRLEDGNGTETMVTRYQLLTHLGQAYYELEEMETAVSTLQQATALENNPRLNPAFHSAHPHYYLALAYEALELPSADIVAEWEAALSYLDDDNPIGWETAVREHLEDNRQ